MSSENKKIHFFLACYNWSANGQHGEGYKVLHSSRNNLIMKDLNGAIDIIKEQVMVGMSHDKKAIKVIFTNMIHLNYCTKDEFYKDCE